MAKNKKLNLSAIKSAHSKEFTQRIVTIDIDGTNYEVLVDQKFQLSKIKELAKEGLNYFEEFEKLDETDRINWFHFLIIKHFTNMKEELDKVTDFSNQLVLMKQFANLGITDKISQYFIPEEIEKVGKELSKMTEYVKKYGKEHADSEETGKLIDEEIRKIEGTII